VKPIDQRADLRRYYQDRGVVGTYMRRRTGQPLNGVLHRSQVRFLNRVLARRGPRAVLEIACGPGRLTAEVQGVQLGVAVDASPAMLETAKRRLNGSPSRWSFLRTDAFVLPFRSEVFDAVYTLRFLRHFQVSDRQRLYEEIRRVLRPGGLLMLDALNRDVSLPYRIQRGIEKYHIYDMLYRREEIEAELQAAGFRLTAVQSIIKHPRLQRRLNRLRRIKLDRIASVLIGSLEHIPGSNPTDWMLLCERQF
jgi:ubiquinone/menaquinone biosynthesis C-methylase UbiE